MSGHSEGCDGGSYDNRCTCPQSDAPGLRRALNGIRSFINNRPRKGRPPAGCSDATLLRWVLKELKATEKFHRLAKAAPVVLAVLRGK